VLLRHTDAAATGLRRSARFAPVENQFLWCVAHDDAGGWLAFAKGYGEISP
jgi:hypothetical protein